MDGTTALRALDRSFVSGDRGHRSTHGESVAAHGRRRVQRSRAAAAVGLVPRPTAITTAASSSCRGRQDDYLMSVSAARRDRVPARRRLRRQRLGPRQGVAAAAQGQCRGDRVADLAVRLCRRRRFRAEAAALAREVAQPAAIARHYLHLGERQRRTYFADTRAVPLKRSSTRCVRRWRCAGRGCIAARRSRRCIFRRWLRRANSPPTSSPSSMTCWRAKR